MAIKVNYNSTQGLVQELDPTGAGGFLVNGTDIGQKVLTKLEVDAEALGDAKVPLDVDKDVILVTTKGTQNNEHITLKIGTYFGQIITVVYFAEGHQNDNLQIFGNHTADGIASPQVILSGLVLSPVKVQAGSTESSTVRLMWIGNQWIPLGR